MPPADMPPVISLYPGQAHPQDERLGVQAVVLACDSGLIAPGS
jgi:hypothetical protein